MPKCYAARVESFGYLHGAPSADASLVIDLRHLLDDPIIDMAMGAPVDQARQVLEYVASASHTREIVGHVVGLARALGHGHARPPTAVGMINGYGSISEFEVRVGVAYGCDSGRYWAVAMAILTERALAAAGWRTELSHRDVGV